MHENFINNTKDLNNTYLFSVQYNYSINYPYIIGYMNKSMYHTLTNKDDKGGIRLCMKIS